MLERQKIIYSLVDKAILYADGSVTIKGLIEVPQIDVVGGLFYGI
jgi:hypothetical protein